MKKVVSFDIEKARSGDYDIVTRDGNKVSVLCWDKKGEGGKISAYPIVALVESNGGSEWVYSYNEKGEENEGCQSGLDLVLRVEVELMELLNDFEIEVGKLLYDSIDTYSKLEEVKRVARNLYDVAREESDERDYQSVLKGCMDYCLCNRWRKSGCTGVGKIRYTLQGGVIYDCVSGMEVSVKDVIDILLKSMNKEGE